MPKELVDKIKKASTFNQGFETTEYLASAIMDMKFHLTDPSNIDVDKFEKETLDDLKMPSELPMRHRTPHFGHVFSGEGYATAYYGYMWADVLTSDASEAFAEAPGGFYDKDVAKKKGSQPKKYYAKDADGDEMSKSTKDKRAAHFQKNKDKEGEDAFKPAPGDSQADTKPSQHTKKYKKMFGEGAADKSLQKKADKSGMPVGILKQVYKRGVAAWKGGHRPGTTPEQWGHARVNSFVTKSKGTWGGADKDLAKQVRGRK